MQPDALNNIIDLYMGRRHVISGNILAEGVKLLRETAPSIFWRRAGAAFTGTPQQHHNRSHIDRLCGRRRDRRTHLSSGCFHSRNFLEFSQNLAMMLR